MMPMTNVEIAERNRQIADARGTKSGAPPIPPVLHGYRYGAIEVIWQADPRVPAEVRDSSGTVIHTGTREECINWAANR